MSDMNPGESSMHPEQNRPPIIPPGPTYTTPVPTPPAPKRRTGLWITLIVGAFFLGGCLGGSIGYGAGSSSAKPQAAATHQTYFPDCPFAAGGCPSSAAPNAVKASSVAPSPTKAAPPPPPPSPTPIAIEDGVWTVGVDIPPGSYRTTANVAADCYWKITKTGSNGDIIRNDIPGGGRPQVTLAAGQDFTSSNCGTWHKVG